MLNIETLYWVLLIACLVLAAFFNSSEIAFFSLQRIRLEHLINAKVRGAERVVRMIERPDRLLAIVLLGTNFVNTAAAALATALAIRYWPEYGVLIATIGLTIILLIFVEMTPKMIAVHHCERLSLTFARPLEALSWLLRPFVVALSWIAPGLTKMVGGAPVPRPQISEEEIRTMISVGHKEGTVEEEAAEMLDKVFEFGDRPVREVMVPRPEVVCIEQGSKLSDFFSLYTQSPLARFPVFQENMDNVVGILSIKDALMAMANGTVNNESVIDSLIRPAYLAPETKPIGGLFVEMRDKNYHLCVVVDEYGGTAGIVGLTQLIGEIVGPMGDELAAAEKEYEVINAYTFQIDGGMRIEEANEEMGLELPEGDDYETVAGFVLYLLGHFPETSEQLRYRDLRLVVTEMRGSKIEKIQLTKGSHAARAD